MKHNWLKLAIAIIGCELIGILSTPFTLSAIPTWYATLNKPFFSPPNWVFGPVWTLLYALIGISAYLIWMKGHTKPKIEQALKFFLYQLALNFAWSFLFFGLHSPLLGFLDIIAMWIMILLTMLKFNKLSEPAAFLMVPYFTWVSFATLLNASILLLN